MIKVMNSPAETVLKIKRINAGAYGKIRVLVDSCGRIRGTSAGSELASLPILNLIYPQYKQYVKC